MDLEQLNCNNCGAPLSVPETANFVTCNHCRTQLAIRRTESSTFTEKLEKIEDRQNQVIEKLQSLERQNRLAAIDRQWERERERLLVSDKHGRRYEPSKEGALIGAGLACVIGVVLLTFAWPFGLLFIAAGVAIGLYGTHKAKEFDAARRRYRRRRKQVFRSMSNGTPSSEEYLAKLEHIPTPQEYLQDLEQH